MTREEEDNPHCGTVHSHMCSCTARWGLSSAWVGLDHRSYIRFADSGSLTKRRPYRRCMEDANHDPLQDKPFVLSCVRGGHFGNHPSALPRPCF
jgi:hypothetical protein